MGGPRPDLGCKDGLRSSNSKSAGRWGRSAKELAQDDIVMATNSSSIVSKRSVEKIYYPNEPQFLHHFVKRFQRRSPLINRGYQIRMHVIDHAVHKFLHNSSEKTKVVVNLGCGSDVFPWQCWIRYPELCKHATFVDIDFPDLMKQKCEVVRNTPELREPLGHVVNPDNDQVFLNTDRYVQIGCDLRELDKIEASLLSVLDLKNCTFLFVAEVSITYMETEGADEVIRWASTLGEAKFCLLEQILPDGPGHPFARTMLSHFDKLNAPPKSAFAYSTLQAQAERFRRLGWSQADAQSLWQIWSDDNYFTAEQRKALDDAEPFDEWEEFALYASHYVVVSAKTITSEQPTPTNIICPSTTTRNGVAELETSFRPYDGSRGQRRFGAALKTTDTAAESTISNVFGLGTTTRLRSQDNYGQKDSPEVVDVPTEGPTSRMCHAIVNVGSSGNILCGGRLSPTRALKDTWLLDPHSKSWSQSNDLPVPLYRHSITALGTDRSLALVVGGKTDASSVFAGCLIFQDSQWVECHIMGDYKPVFGATLISLPHVEELATALRFHGVLMGGMLEDGTIAKQTLGWTLSVSPDVQAPSISFAPLEFGDEESCQTSAALVNRFGATSLLLDDGDMVVIGGIIADGILTPAQEIYRIRVVNGEHDSRIKARLLPPKRLATSAADVTVPRPLLIGTSAALDDNGNLIVMGGGAICFSMGSFWNSGYYTVRIGHD